MAQDYYKMTGQKLNVNSAYRDYNTQAKLRAEGERKYGNKVSSYVGSPGYSKHQSGIDINSADVKRLKKLGLLDKYGFNVKLEHEQWHIEDNNARNVDQRTQHEIARLSKLGYNGLQIANILGLE